MTISFIDFVVFLYYNFITKQLQTFFYFRRYIYDFKKINVKITDLYDNLFSDQNSLSAREIFLAVVIFITIIFCVLIVIWILRWLKISKSIPTNINEHCWLMLISQRIPSGTRLIYHRIFWDVSNIKDINGINKKSKEPHVCLCVFYQCFVSSCQLYKLDECWENLSDKKARLSIEWLKVSIVTIQNIGPGLKNWHIPVTQV